jgi:hypothetical protein
MSSSGLSRQIDWREECFFPARKTHPGVFVRIARQALFTRTLTLLGLAVLGSPEASEAQVGLRSGVAQVTLLARVPAQGSIEGISVPRETRRVGQVSEATGSVRLSANTGYQLQVRRIPGAPTRMWVQASNGTFQELTPGASITVAQDQQSAGETEREVRFRIEIPSNETAPAALPVRYEMALKPTL